MAVASNPTVKLLKKAKKLIADPRHWRKYWYAATPEGARVLPWAKEAESFCSLGAIIRASETGSFVAENGPAAQLLQKVIAEKSFKSVPAFNDDTGTTHTDVMVAFDAAIRLAKEAG